MNGRDWHRVALSEVASLQLSSVDKKSKPDEQRVRLCNYTDVYNNDFIRSDMEFMWATATEREVSKCSLYVGDVIITKDSEKYDDIGVPAFIREEISDLVCGYHLAILRPAKPVIDGMFLFYMLKHNETKHQFHARANGITRFGLRKDDIKSVEIFVPPLHEQQRIARILGTIDDKIELNRRMSKTLEEMARALFRSWFVDFYPIRAKIEGRWRPGESLPGLPAYLYDLFPDSLVHSKIGEIPEGWETGILGEHFRLTMGQSPPGSTYNNIGNGLPFFQGRTDFGFRYPTNRRFCTAPSRVADPGDTLVSIRAPVGDINMAWEMSCIGRGVAALRHRSESSSFTYYSALMIQDQIQQYEHTGTVFGAITKGQFASLPTVEPPTVVVNEFGKYASPWDHLIRLATKQTNMLSSLRDALLPQLMSGSVRRET